MHVNFELSDTLGGKGMRNGLSLSTMLGSVSCVEETSLNGDEHIVVLTVIPSERVLAKNGLTYAFKKPLPCP